MAENENGDAGKLARYALVGQVFTPFAPVDRFSLFAGRNPQIMEVVDAINQRGQHAVLYGERGVGKTSLANVLPEVFVVGKAKEPLWSVKVNCATTDDYFALWSRIFREIGQEEDFKAFWTDSPPDPEDVRYLLHQLDRRLLIVMDELDRLEDGDALSSLADTIKALSDHSVDVTLVMVGVADSIDELIGDHRSIQRNLTQVPMQRMSLQELEQIVDAGLDQLDLQISEEARRRIGRLSEGLPFYTHLLALHAGQRTVRPPTRRSTQFAAIIKLRFAAPGKTISSPSPCLPAPSPRRMISATSPRKPFKSLCRALWESLARSLLSSST